MSEPVPVNDYVSANMSRVGYPYEAALIGSILRRPSQYADVKDFIEPKDFGWVPYGRVWAAFQGLDSDNMRIDAITVGDELERSGFSGEYLSEFIMHDSAVLTGRAAISQLRDAGEPGGATDYAVLVADYSAKRKLGLIANKLFGWAANGRKAADIVSDITQEISAIKTPGSLKSKSLTMHDAVRLAANHTYDAAAGKISYFNTGFPDLDALTEGLMPSDLCILAGRPGDGKTALLGSIAKNAADDGKRVMFFTLEMASKQLAMRFLSMESGVSFGKQKTGKLTEDEWTRYNAAIEKIGSDTYPVIFNDMPSITPSAMRREMRLHGKFDLVILDYVQLAGADGKFDNRVLQIGAITAGLKILAREFDVPILAAAQLSRKAEERGEQPPRLSDLRESGSIENDADQVIFIHRPNKAKSVANIIVEKNRNGNRGLCQLVFVGAKTRYESISQQARVQQSQFEEPAYDPN